MCQAFGFQLSLGYIRSNQSADTMITAGELASFNCEPREPIRADRTISSSRESCQHSSNAPKQNTHDLDALRASGIMSDSQGNENGERSLFRVTCCSN